MQIEGTPNERALLVVFAYVVGFVSAFIAFGLSQDNLKQTNVTFSTYTQPASVVTAVEESQTTEPSLTETDQVVLVYENDGLYLHTDAEFPTLLSKAAAAVGYTYDNDASLSDKQGFHTAVPYFEHIAPLGHVFYCEQYSTTGTCTPFLYDISEQELYVFTYDGEPLELDSREVQQLVVTSAGSYVLGNYRSASVDTAWELVMQ